MNKNGLMIAFVMAASQLTPSTMLLGSEADRPNIVIIVTDDMGFSDIGCYGGEIETPNIDRLAAGGIRFSQFYNCSKCEPSRLTLITGHRWETKLPEVNVRRDAPTLGQVAQSAGYRTMMVGKWHVQGSPFERGFNRHFGFMGGGTNFFLGDKSFTLDGQPWPVPEEDFYVTEALSDCAVRFIREEYGQHSDRPFLLYLAYNAPHSPIQALPEDVVKYRGRYRVGWDVIRKRRFQHQQEMGLAGPGWHFPERPAGIPAWDSLDEKSQDFEDLRMATYAGMIDCVDRGVGQVVQTLEELGIRDNTLVLFMNDNGASPNDRARRGEFGSPDSHWNVGLGWAHASNTPFKFYKRTQHSGGTTTPFIASWPSVIAASDRFEDQPCHFIDLLPTIVELTGAKYPTHRDGKPLSALPGRSIVPVLKERTTLPDRTLHFSLFNNFGVVDRGWRLVTAYGQPWQLYDLTNDRTETRDLAAQQPERLAEMLRLQADYAARPDVALRISGGEREPQYASAFRPDGSIGPPAREKVADPEFSRLASIERSKGRQLSARELAAIRAAAERANQRKAKTLRTQQGRLLRSDLRRRTRDP